MAEKTYLFKGLDVRANQLERQGNTARDCSNVRLDSNNRLEKIEEFAALSLPYEGTSTPANWDDELPTGSSIIDFVEFNGDFILFVKVPPLTSSDQDFAVSLYKYDIVADTVQVIPCNMAENNKSEVGFSNWGSIAFDGKLTTFEKDGCLYFQSSSNSDTGDGAGTPLMGKYDGLVWHCAGVNPISSSFPSDADEGTLAGANWYVRTVPMHIDNQGNQTFGEWRVYKYTIGGTNIQDFRGYHTNKNNYNTSYIYSTSAQNLTDASLTINAFTTDILEGEVVMFLDKSIYRLYRFEVASKTGSTVTFQNPKIYQDGGWVDAGTFSLSLVNFDFFTNTLLLAYYSRDYSAGYVYGDMGISTTLGSGNFVIDFDPAAPETVPDWSLFSTNFVDFYGSEIKGNPPAGLQIREYGDACILLSSTLLYFSDLSLNGRVENFTAFDNFNVGEEEKGSLVSFFSNETFIAVFRETDSYLVTGNVFTGNYRVLSYRSTGVGGTSPTSIIEVEGQCLFMSNRGPEIAMENATMAKTGDRVEPIFTSDDVLGLTPDLSKCDVFLDEGRELVYMFVQSQNGTSDDFVIVYDYRNNEWFRYDLSMRGGLAVRKSTKELYYSDGTDLYKEQSAYSSGIDAYWTSNYETLGKASFKKRFQRLHLFLTNLNSGSIGFKAFRDWISSTPYTNQTITPSSSIPMDNRRLDPKLTYSTSFQILSTGTNVLSIDGFEYSYEVEQEALNDDVRG